MKVQGAADAASPDEPTRGTLELLFPLVTHGKNTCFAAAAGHDGCFCLRASLCCFLFCFMIFLKIFGMKTSGILTFPRSLASPAGIFPPCSVQTSIRRPLPRLQFQG